jgi:hypothetical protein
MKIIYGLVNPSFASAGITLNFIKPIIEYCRSLLTMNHIRSVFSNKTKNANARNSRHIGKNNQYIKPKEIKIVLNRKRQLLKIEDIEIPHDQLKQIREYKASRVTAWSGEYLHFLRRIGGSGSAPFAMTFLLKWQHTRSVQPS